MLEINRDRAISMLEQRDPNWDYEDMTDEELVERIVQDIKCRPENRMMNRCRGMECKECWERVLSA